LKLNRRSFISLIIAGMIIPAGLAETADAAGCGVSAGGTGYSTQNRNIGQSQKTSTIGITLPVKWSDLGKQMIKSGVIDKNKFESLYTQRGGLNKYETDLLYGNNNGYLKINKQNSRFVLNLLWGIGFGNKNSVLSSLSSPRFGGDPSRFASTGGWTLSNGYAMNHFNKYNFIKLTSSQQKLVERVSHNIYRPCCDNPVALPDCNHGMAMLGLLELMASQNITEQNMYKIALQVNSQWFPNTYLAINTYFSRKGLDVSPRTALGIKYSSGTGYRRVLAGIRGQSPQSQDTGGGSCGV